MENGRWSYSVGVVKACQQLGEAAGVAQKQPAHHCLKSRRPAIERRLAATRSAAGAVAALAHQLQFFGVESTGLLQPIEGGRLGIGADLSHNRAMQVGAAARPAAVAHPLMQFPHGITQPCQLQRAELIGLVHRSRIGLPEGRG